MVGKYVGRFEIIFFLGVLIDFKVGNCGLYGIKLFLWMLIVLWSVVKYLFNYCYIINVICMKMKRLVFLDILNIMRGRVRIIKEEEIYIEWFKINFIDIMIL